MRKTCVQLVHDVWLNQALCTVVNFTNHHLFKSRSLIQIFNTVCAMFFAQFIFATSRVFYGLYPVSTGLLIEATN